MCYDQVTEDNLIIGFLGELSPWANRMNKKSHISERNIYIE